MSTLSQINLNGTDYEIEDAYAREQLENISGGSEKEDSVATKISDWFTAHPSANNHYLSELTSGNIPAWAFEFTSVTAGTYVPYSATKLALFVGATETTDNTSYAYIIYDSGKILTFDETGNEFQNIATVNINEFVTNTDLQNALSGITGVRFEVVSTLPTENISTSTIYLVANSSDESENGYDEYIYIDEDGTLKWEKVGSVGGSIDLSGYATTTELNTGLAGKINKPSGVANNKIAVTDSEESDHIKWVDYDTVEYANAFPAPSVAGAFKIDMDDAQAVIIYNLVSGLTIYVGSAMMEFTPEVPLGVRLFNNTSLYLEYNGGVIAKADVDETDSHENVPIEFVNPVTLTDSNLGILTLSGTGTITQWVYTETQSATKYSTGYIKYGNDYYTLPGDIPSKTSDLVNDSDFVNSTQLATGLAGKVALPSVAGTEGQVLALDNSLAPVWKTVESGGGTEYTAGDGITITDDEISVTDPIPAHTSSDSGKVLNVESDGTLAWAEVSGGEGTTYTAGTGISINGSTISTAYHTKTTTLEALEYSQTGEIHNDDFSINDLNPEGHRGYIDFDYAYPGYGDPLFSTEIAKSFVDKWKAVGDDYKNAVIHLKCTFSNGITYEDDLTAYDGGSGWNATPGQESMDFVKLDGTWPLFVVRYRAQIENVRIYITYRRLDESVFDPEVDANIYLTSVEVTDNYTATDTETSEKILPDFIPVSGDITVDNSVIKTIYGGGVVPTTAYESVEVTVDNLYNDQDLTFNNDLFDVLFDNASTIIDNMNNRGKYITVKIIEGTDTYTIEPTGWTFYADNVNDIVNRHVVLNYASKLQIEVWNKAANMSFCRIHNIDDLMPDPDQSHTYKVKITIPGFNKKINSDFIEKVEYQAGTGGIYVDNSAKQIGFQLDPGTLIINNMNRLTTVLDPVRSNLITKTPTTYEFVERVDDGNALYKYAIDCSTIDERFWDASYFGNGRDFVVIEGIMRNPDDANDLRGFQVSGSYSTYEDDGAIVESYTSPELDFRKINTDGVITYTLTVRTWEEYDTSVYSTIVLTEPEYRFSVPNPINAQYIPIDNNTITEDNGVLKVNAIPDLPDTDGTYTLQVTIHNGTPTYEWVSQE